MNARHRQYVKLRVDGLKQVDAAIGAGYSARTAAQAASRVEAMPKIQDALKRERARRDPGAAATVAALKTDKPGKRELRDPLQFFSDMMADDEIDPEVRLKAAQQLANFTIARPSTAKPSKDEGRKARAEQSFFAQPTPLKAVK